MFARKVRTYPSEETFSCSILGQALCLAHKHSTRLERPAKDKHSSLLLTHVNYGHTRFITLGPGMAWLPDFSTDVKGFNGKVSKHLKIVVEAFTLPFTIIILYG